MPLIPRSFVSTIILLLLSGLILTLNWPSDCKNSWYPFGPSILPIRKSDVVLVSALTNAEKLNASVLSKSNGISPTVMCFVLSKINALPFGPAVKSDGTGPATFKVPSFRFPDVSSISPSNAGPRR